MEKPTLVVLAAGMGSRYGGLKQIDPVGPHGEIIIDYSLYDAMQAGFEKVVFIINRNIENDFKEVIGNRVAKKMEVGYVYQQLDSMFPAGMTPPADRVKPWGTSHAILCCKDAVKGPFGIINADDYYGKSAYKVLYDRLKTAKDGEKYDFCMVGYILENTLTDAGSVARGVCVSDERHQLVDIVERLKIYKTPDGAAYTEDDGKTFVKIPAGSPVSMNMWGFTPSLFDELEARFPTFLKNAFEKNPLKAEMLIPNEVGALLKEGKAAVEVLSSPDRWFGVTYREDKPIVMADLKKMTDAGVYPDHPLF